MNNLPSSDLFVLELANNHMGDVEHGINVIQKFGDVCKQYPEFSFAFKLQYRQLDSFVHPSMKDRLDLKYIKRFHETRLSRQDFDRLVAEIRANGFLAMCTPFDNASVGVIVEQQLDIIKVASCSFTDWPLLEEIVKAEQPIIASTAGASLDEIDRVVSFLTHRNKSFAILHCVGEYPTADEKLHLNQIDLLRERYPSLRIGFSTHEDPNNIDIVKMAVAKGVNLFEKHVGVATDKYALNGYSAAPAQIQSWLEAVRYAKKVCGVRERTLIDNPAEKQSLQSLRRGVFARGPIRAGELINTADVYFAFPPQEGQFTANDWGKYAHFTATSDIALDGAIAPANALFRNDRAKVLTIADQVRGLIIRSGVVVPSGIDLEISHHYGLEKFDEFGLTMLTVVNRGYCKKLLVSLPGQHHPEQFHHKKEETFHILFGEVHLYLNGEKRVCVPGDVVNVPPGERHAFTSPDGSIIEEISSTHFKDDSYYTDESIMLNKNRKTLLTFWMG
jgi:sialic acid synthase SpsE/mannose-6-phosphate isomerase-like protein (cupin superfamily)